MKACSRCGKRAARNQLYNWRPDLCADCAEQIKHPTMRAAADWVTREQADEANRMLAELEAYQIPANWMIRAAEHIGQRTGETSDNVLRRWAAEERQ